MEITYLKSWFITEPTYPGFHEYFKIYKVLTRFGIINCQVPCCENMRLKKYTFVSISGMDLKNEWIHKVKQSKEKFEFGIILGIEEKKSEYNAISNWNNFNRIPIVTELSQYDVDSNEYFYVSFLLIKFQKKLHELYSDSELLGIISLVDLKLDHNDNKILIYYKLSKNNYYWDFREYVGLCFKESKCRIELVKKFS